MGEEELQARAEIVLARISVSRKYEPVFGAAPIAQRSDLAALALASEGIALVVSEFALCG
jgi:hypothetical protein